MTPTLIKEIVSVKNSFDIEKNIRRDIFCDIKCQCTSNKGTFLMKILNTIVQLSIFTCITTITHVNDKR